MINNDKFIINELKNVVLFGFQKTFKEIIKFNNNLKLKTLIITSPDQKKLFDKNLEVFSFNKVDDKFKRFIKDKFNPIETLFISIGSRWIFKKDDIEKYFKNNLVNFHGTRLPFDKGGAFISWKIMKNDRIENQMIHLLDGSIDTGPILLHDNSIYPSYCKVPYDFEKYYDSRQLNFYKKFIKKLLNKENIFLKRQVEYVGSYNPRLNSDISSWINWNMNSQNLYRFINAFDDPYKGARTYINDMEVRIKSVHLHGGEQGNHPFSTGLIYRHDKKWLVVSTIDENMILIEKVFNNKNQNVIDKLKEGDRFHTPSIILDKSLTKKVKYTSKGLE